MTEWVVEPPPRPGVDVAGASERFPVGRIFCVGRNYAAHAREMGEAADPVFFMKPAASVSVPHHATPYPPDTDRLDHEIELVLAIGASGRPSAEAEARELIFGYAAGVDLTRRDTQARLKAAGAPWESAKAFPQSAPVSAIAPAQAIGHPRTGRIWLDVNGAMRQDGELAEMILSPEALLIRLAAIWTLQPGDLIFTGTPSGVGPLARGDRVRGGVADVGEIALTVV